MATLTNIMKSIKNTPQCRPSAGVGHRAPEERAWVGHSLTFKPHAMSDMQWEALKQNKQYHRRRKREGEGRIWAERMAAKERICAAELIQSAWRKKHGIEFFRGPLLLVASESESDSDSDSESDDFYEWLAGK